MGCNAYVYIVGNTHQLQFRQKSRHVCTPLFLDAPLRRRLCMSVCAARTQFVRLLVLERDSEGENAHSFTSQRLRLSDNTIIYRFSVYISPKQQNETEKKINQCNVEAQKSKKKKNKKAKQLVRAQPEQNNNNNTNDAMRRANICILLIVVRSCALVTTTSSTTTPNGRHVSRHPGI